MEMMNRNKHLAEKLTGFRTIQEAIRSSIYRENEAWFKNLFGRPVIIEFPNAVPRLKSFLRVIEWNIEYGCNLKAAIGVLNEHPQARYADLMLLNEVDDGMARSANVDEPMELSRALAAHAVYGVEYLELTRGNAQHRDLEADNTNSLHGNAIFTRYPISSAEVVRLPRCENNFESPEKRVGGRVAIMAGVSIGGKTLAAVTAHLDVINTPRCRGRQLCKALDAVDRRAGARPVLIGGDFNTHTFARGGRLRAYRNMAKVALSNRERLGRALLSPQGREPALKELLKRGYNLDRFNDGVSTARVIAAQLNDATTLPGFLRRAAIKRVGPNGIQLDFRLDWFAGRGLRALTRGEVIDKETGVASTNPVTLGGLTVKGVPISDHDPILVDLDINW